MKRATEPTTFALASMLIAAGCAAGRPAVEDSEPEAVTTSDTLVGTSTSASSTTPGPKVCTPGTARECKTYWTDPRGQLHCMVQEQLCRSDGHAWQPCGDLDAGPLPEAGAGEDAEADASGAPLR